MGELAKQRFEAEMLKELERRGFAIRGFTANGFSVVDGRTGAQKTIDTAIEYKSYMDGAGIGTIVDGLFKEAQPKKPVLKGIIPVVKDGRYLKYWIADVKKQNRGEPAESELPLLAKVPGHDLFIYYADGATGKPGFLRRGDLARLGMDEKALMESALKNLEKIIAGMISNGKVVVSRQSDWAWTFRMELAPSFILVAHRFMDFIGKHTGVKSGFVYAFVISEDELMIVDPGIHLSMLPGIKKIVEIRQEMLEREGRESIRLPALKLTKEGYIPFEPR